MSIHVDIPAQELAAIKRITRLDDDAQAVARAAREFLRMSRLRELKAASGMVEFDSDWQNLEELELGETGLPQ